MTIRFSIGRLMAVIFCVAADFALMRALWSIGEPPVLPALATLPMANLLLLATPKLRVANRTRHFWLGFEVVGWIMVLAVGHLYWHHPGTFFWPLEVFRRSLGLINNAAGIALMISFTVFLYLTPQLLAAVLAGRWSARYRVVIERR